MSKQQLKTSSTHTLSGRAADFVVDQIEARILSEELLDGETLPAERDLMTHYGVSRTVIREAIRILAGKGLIETKPRHRPVIKKAGYESAFDTIGGIIGHLLDDPRGVKNLFETRVLLEAALVRQAALHADKDDIRALKEALQANKESIEDSQQFYATDVAFHSVLYKISQNPVLPAIHKAYTGWLASHWKKMPRLPERNRLNYEAHKEIYNAILSRDPDEAEKALRRHLDIAWKFVKETFHWDD